MFDTGWRRVDCICGCTFFAPTTSKANIRLRESVSREALARQEERLKR